MNGKQIAADKAAVELELKTKVQEVIDTALSLTQVRVAGVHFRIDPNSTITKASASTTTGKAAVEQDLMISVQEIIDDFRLRTNSRVTGLHFRTEKVGETFPVSVVSRVTASLDFAA